MEKVKKDILNLLEQLKEEEFKRFKWNLGNCSSPEDPRVIPPCYLESADRMDTVDLMVRCYHTDSLQVAMKVLKEMQKNDVAETLFKRNPNSTGELNPGGGDGGPETSVCQRELKSKPPETFRVEPDGVRWLRPGLRKYSWELTTDTNTVNRMIKLSDNNRKVIYVWEDQSYPDHPHRFDSYRQLLCRTGLTGRCYWEVEWRGSVIVSVSYGGIRRKGNSDDCRFGRNDQSWSLECCDGGFSVCHNNTVTRITSSSSSSSSSSGRVAVYVDWPAGSLSFFRVSSDTLIHLHTFSTTFTGPLYPGFGFGFGLMFWLWFGSSVSLCPLQEEAPPAGGEPSSLLSTQLPLWRN
ncbi:tripartite motif-containing protein 16-like [Spinachia spinachia]